eukprot:TRINITY_DN81669_c0_g1_i1.p1 TRINITY_DN81669_c0_g1~~TRINITY_DN81669_c0_g1_i1.p1  ORF type:complete len:200 (-),score=55.12 TRINITY_DN81669_c0_g1_i1:362-961(-)
MDEHESVILGHPRPGSELWLGVGDFLGIECALSLSDAASFADIAPISIQRILSEYDFVDICMGIHSALNRARRRRFIRVGLCCPLVTFCTPIYTWIKRKEKMDVLKFFNRDVDAFEKALVEKTGEHGYPSWYAGLRARGIDMHMIADNGDIMLRFSFSDELELLQVGKTVYTHHHLDQMDSRFSYVGDGIRSIDSGGIS